MERQRVRDTYHECDKEVESGDFSVRNENRAVPEDEGDYEEGYGLGESVDSVTKDRRPI